MPVLDRISIDGAHGKMDAHLARPNGMGPVPAVLLLQEGIGVTTHLLGLARQLAEQGYLALVPDLYSRDQARKQLDERDVIEALPLARASNREALIAELPRDKQASARRVLDWFMARDTSTYLPDARAAVSYLQRHEWVRTDAIGTLGFSLGGALSALIAASGEPLAAGVIFYGHAPPIEQVPNILYPLQIHYAAQDPGITSRLPAFQAALKAAGKQFKAFVYEGTKHGFFNEARPAYDAGAAQLSLDRTLCFFKKQLSSSSNDVPAQGLALPAFRNLNPRLLASGR